MTEKEELSHDVPGEKLVSPFLPEMLAAHQRWLETKGNEGMQADLSNYDFKDFGLAGADLRKANLAGAKFTGVDLREVNLQHADLEDADLSNAENLVTSQLAGANLKRARLPEGIQKFEELNNIAESSKTASHTFLVMVAACVYVWLTVASTTDASLLTNSFSCSLPIIQTSIPIVGFYLAAPALLLAIFIYFHIHLRNNWEGLANLPAIFPDGRRLDQVVYPWFLNGFVCAHFPILRDHRPPFSRFQVLVSLFLAWIFVPLTLFLIWGRYIIRHDWLLTFLHISLFLISLYFMSRSLTLTRSILRGGTPKLILRWLALIVASVVIIGISFGMIHGMANDIDDLKVEHYSMQRLIPRVFSFVRCPFANLEEVDVSTKPANWTGKEEEIAFVKGAPLKDRNLRYVKAKGSFLVNADLRSTDLLGADLRFADLRKANLWRANLQKAKLEGSNLWGANLEKAELIGANLRKVNVNNVNLKESNLQQADLSKTYFETVDLTGAILIKSDLQDSRFKNVFLSNSDLTAVNLVRAQFENVTMAGSKLNGANLKWSRLQKTNLRGTDLQGANLEGASLEGAEDLEVTKIRLAHNWPLAFYNKVNIERLGLPLQHNELLKARNLSNYNLQSLNLREADLQGANLENANLEGANLERARLNFANLQRCNLKGANLKGADLQDARGLTREGLNAAIFDEKTKLPSDL
jgi:uncharacterized protein YjbI with pentapeptide repeats